MEHKENEIIYYALDDTDYSNMEIDCNCGCQSPITYNPEPLSGDVVEVSEISGKYRKCITKYSNKVIGVCCGEILVSDNKYIPIAVYGRVRVNTVGLIRIGDLLTSSYIPGKAMSVEYDRAHKGTIIGKCIEMTDKENEVIMQIFLN